MLNRPHFFKRLAAVSTCISILATTVFFSSYFLQAQAAETVTLVFDSYTGSVVDTSNATPGLRLLPGTAVGYYANLTNNSTLYNLSSAYVTIDFTASTDISGRFCEYVTAITGSLRPDFDSVTTTPCVETNPEGSTYRYAITGDLLIGETAYFRVSGLVTTATAGSKAFGGGAFTTPQTVAVSALLNNFFSVSTAHITGTVFYDNGTPNNASNGFQDTGELGASGITVSVTDGIMNYSGTTDVDGIFDISVPHNDIATYPSAAAYTVSHTPSLGFRATNASSIGDIRVSVSSSVSLFGITNQGDLALTYEAVPASPFTENTDVTFIYTVTNQGPTTVTGIVVNIPYPGATTATGTTIASDGHVFAPGVEPGTVDWTISSMAPATTVMLEIPRRISSAGTVVVMGEITQMSTPAPLNGFAGDLDSTPNNGYVVGFGEDDTINVDLIATAEPSLSGTVYEDLNNNQTNDSEPGLSRIISLRHLDGIDPDAVIGTTTSTSGVFTFNNTNISGGDPIISGDQYQISIDPVAGYTLTTANAPQIIIATSGSANFTPIGYFQPSSISGHAFDDQNHSGSQDIGEPNLSGVTVHLLSSDLITIDSTTTSALTGVYAFNDLSAGTYYISMDNPAGYTATYYSLGVTENDLDSSDNNTTIAFVLGANEDLTGVDGGFFSAAGIEGRVFHDLNYNDRFDTGETGQAGVHIELFDDNNISSGSATTDSDGLYSIGGLVPGNYYIQLDSIPSHFAYATRHISGSDEADDSDIYPETDRSDILALSAGVTTENINAGLQDTTSDLRIIKTVDNNLITVGDTVIYTLTVTNLGPAPSIGAVINDLLPEQVSYVEDDSSGITGTYDSESGIWTLNQLAADEAVTIHITVTVNSAGVVTNTASTGSPQPDSDTSNNSSSVEVISQSITPSLDIQKWVLLDGDTETTDDSTGPETLPPSVLTYYIDVTNTSTVALSELNVEDVFPTQLSTSGWTCAYHVATGTSSDHSGSYNTLCTVGINGIIGSVSTLAAENTLHIRLQQINAAQTLGAYCNEATAEATDTGSESDSACFQVVSNIADLSLEKDVTPEIALIGEDIVFELTVTNLGPITSTGAIVTDLLPSELTYISDDGNAENGSYNSENGHWTLPDLENGEQATLHITTRASATGEITNTATITKGQLQTDNNGENDIAERSVIITPPVPTVQKWVLNDSDATESTHNSTGPQIAANTPLTYFIDVANETTVTITNLEVMDLLPEPLTTDWTCTYVVNTSEINDHTATYSEPCTIEDNGTINAVTSLTSNEVLHIQLSGQNTPTTAGTYCNQVNVAANGFTTAVSDLACIQVEAATPALAITHTASAGSIPGGQTTYTISVHNTGSATANNVVITDNLSDEINNLIPSCILSVGQIIINDAGVLSPDSPNTIQWFIGDIEPGDTVAVSLIATIRDDITSATNCQTTAIISSDNAPTEQAEATINIPVTTPEGAIITASKTSLSSTTVYEPGDAVQYRITLNNSGLAASSFLSLSDELPNAMQRWQSIQSVVGELVSGTDLTLNSIILPEQSTNIISYTGILKDADDFPLRDWRVSSDATKDDKDFYPEKVIRTRSTSENGHDDGSAALRPGDDDYLSLGSRGSVIMAISTNSKLLVDGDGNDFCIATVNTDETTRLRVSVAQTNNSNSFERIRGNTKNCFDISDADLPWVRYLKIEDQSSSSTGANIDAVCLLHIGGLVRNTATLFQTGSTLSTNSTDIVVNFTDAFDDPLTARDCVSTKIAQARTIELLPPPPAEPLPVLAIAEIMLPSTGTPLLATLIISSIGAAYSWQRKRKQPKRE